MSPYLKTRLSFLHCFAFDFVSFLHFGDRQLTILKRWWSMSGFKEWKERDWFGFSPLSLCVLKLNILKVVTAGTWAEETFCVLINPNFQLDYRGSDKTGNSPLATFHFNGWLSTIFQGLKISILSTDKKFEELTSIQVLIMNIDVCVIKEDRRLCVVYIWVYNFLNAE